MKRTRNRVFIALLYRRYSRSDISNLYKHTHEGLDDANYKCSSHEAPELVELRSKELQVPNMEAGYQVGDQPEQENVKQCPKNTEGNDIDW